MDRNHPFARFLASKFYASIWRFSRIGWLGSGITLVLTAVLMTSQLLPAQGQLTLDTADMAAQPLDLSRVQACARPVEGSLARSPANISIRNGQPAITFALRQVNEGFNDPEGNPVVRRCYVYNGANGSTIAPTIRIKPGDTLTLKIKNELPFAAGMNMPGMAPGNATNVHYHGTNSAPRVPQDEAIKTIIPIGTTYTYALKIPSDAPPGMNWYHPHVHMMSESQVLSGLSGALIVEGMVRAYPKVKKLPEQVFILRDQTPRRNPDTTPDQSFKDISINNVPIVTNPTSTPALISMRDKQAQFWRVANTAADSYMNLQVRYDGVPQNLEVVARDGIVLDEDSGKAKYGGNDSQSILLPPGSRAEFIVPAPRSGMRGEFLALQYNTGIDQNTGDRNLQRTLATIQVVAKKDPLALETIETNEDPKFKPRTRFTNLSQAKISRQRIFYFSQCIDAGTSDPRLSPIQRQYFPDCQTVGTPEFYITEEGQKPRLYSPSDPDSVVVNQGAFEDWRIVNLDAEAHAFHIHQLHFQVLQSPTGQEVGTMRDTINIPGWTGKGTPTFTNLRMDFRGDIIGTFLYHCHILEHEDNGMMAKIRVQA
jgi:FtsP/CotA-like multicopper oxidase with cupredoxin domain